MFLLRVLQTLLIFSILFVAALTLLIVAGMVGAVVVGWRSGNGGVDYYDFLIAFHSWEAIAVLLLMFIGAMFWAGRLFHWRGQAPPQSP